MKKINIYRYVLTFILMVSATQQLQAQEAFYIYRNDGNFDGFFYDQVKHMGYSKVDFEGVEHDVYVVQEIETEDSLYRIPLAAIDSIGFQQPEIRLNPRFNDLRGCGKNFLFQTFGEEKVIRVFEPDSPDGVQVSSMASVGDVICFDSKETREYFGTTGRTETRTVDVPYVCKVTGIDFNLIHYEPITDIGEVFEQFISVEQIGYDTQGNVRSRIAGADQIRRVSGHNDLTIININGRIGYGLELKPGWQFSVSANAEIKEQAEVVYNIKWGTIYTRIKIADEAAFTLSASADVEIDKNSTDNLWEAEVAGGMPVMFPSFLPVFEVRPVPGLFLRSEGHATATLISPKLGFTSKREFTIDTDQHWSNMVSFSSNFEGIKPGDEDNSWKLKLSLNGYVQFGMKVPVRVFSCSWAKELVEMSIGADLYIGPKLSADFSFDATAGNLYDALADTKIDMSLLAVDAEVSATFTGPDPVNWGETYKEVFKLFEAGTTFGTLTLNLLPSFEYVKMYDAFPGSYGVAPRGNFLPCQIGVAVFDSQDRFVNWGGISDAFQAWEQTYSFWDSVDEVRGGLMGALPFGKYKVCPAVYMFDQFMIAKSQGIDYTYLNDGPHYYYPYDAGTTEFSAKNGFSGYLYLIDLDDMASVEISATGDEEAGTFFGYEVEDRIDPLEESLFQYDNFAKLEEYYANTFPKNGFYARKYKWQKIRYWMTGARDDKYKSGYINVAITRDGITKTDGIPVIYTPPYE